MMGQSPEETKELLREAGQEKYTSFYADEIPQHKVCLKGFWMGRFEVTRGQWQKVMKEDPSPYEGGKQFPVAKISWDDANLFIRALNAKNNEMKFRLPTEAEWEYAARGGTDTPFAFGRTINTNQANYNGMYIFGEGQVGLYREKPTKVGTFEPNNFGLHDMHGNVWEWCSDIYHEGYYKRSPETDPTGPALGPMRVLRGGSWFVTPRSTRSANRNGIEPDAAVDDYGFRLVAILPKPRKITPLFDSDF
ncbi:MAG: formylglycine-generating enzyme family protein [Proteobacteria bacterium]|nr:formylglycine-generating enzyme family protein [Pseudomonadota bacterium]MBU1714940.1 formylglycine-generating enzyme family protein [Pseudomonadota bacterium]